MAQRRKKRRYRVRYDRILVVAGMLIVLIILLVSCMKSCGTEEETPQTPTTPISTTAPTPGQENSGGTATTGTNKDGSTENLDLTGYSKINVAKDKIYQGDLILVNRDTVYRFPSDTSNLDSVYLNKLSTYGVKDAFLSLDKNVIKQFNALMQAHYDATYDTDIIVIRGYRSKEDQASLSGANADMPAAGYTELHTGLSFCLGLSPQGYYTNEGDHAWLQEHMPAYGFILRYPEGKEDVTGEAPSTYQFRYVGAPHAVYITENNLTLEEYLASLKEFTFGNKTLKLQIGDSQYEVYYTPAASTGETTLYVPANGNYTLSGNNTDGFIVTCKLN